MDIMKRFLNDLDVVEQVLIKCHGKNGKTALIQSTSTEREPSKYYNVLLVNDCMSILNSIRLPQNYIYNLILKAIVNFNNSNGDNCKAYYVYTLTFLRALMSKQINSDEIQVIINKSSIRIIDELFTKKWKQVLSEAKDENFVFVNSFDKLTNNLNSICCMNDLKSFNRILSTISVDLFKKTLEMYWYGTINSEKDFREQIRLTLRVIEKDLFHMIVYSDHLNIEETRLLKNGFLCKSKVDLELENKTNYSAIFILQSPSISCKDDIVVNLKQSFNLKKSFQEKLYSSEGSKISFSKNFLGELTKNRIDLVLVEGGLSEIKKSQLHSIKCLLLEHLDRDYIHHLLAKLNKFPINSTSINELNINETNNVFEIESIRILEKDKICFLQLPTSMECLNIASIYFCSSTKINFSLFKSFFIKAVKTLKNLFEDNTENILIKSSLFEFYSISIINHIKNNAMNLEDKILWEFFKIVFIEIFSKLNRIKTFNIGDNHEDQVFLTIFKNIYTYEPFQMKMKLFLETFNLVKTISRITEICIVKRNEEC